MYIFAIGKPTLMERPFILADNQDITRQGVVALLSTLGVGERTARARNRKELQNALAEMPDAVVVLDYTLFDFSSMEQMLHQRASARGSIWVLFSNELSASFLRHVLVEDWTMSAVMKTDQREQIERTLTAAATGRAFRCEFALQALRGTPSDNLVREKLTAAEKLVLRDIALGKTTKEIAAEKNLSFHTINAHRKNIFRKLEVNSVHEALRYALRAGIIDMSDYYI